MLFAQWLHFNTSMVWLPTLMALIGCLLVSVLGLVCVSLAFSLVSHACRCCFQQWLVGVLQWFIGLFQWLLSAVCWHASMASVCGLFVSFNGYCLWLLGFPQWLPSGLVGFPQWVLSELVGFLQWLCVPRRGHCLGVVGLCLWLCMCFCLSLQMMMVELA